MMTEIVTTDDDRDCNDQDSEDEDVVVQEIGSDEDDIDSDDDEGQIYESDAEGEEEEEENISNLLQTTRSGRVCEHGPIPRYDTDGKFHKSTIYHWYCCRFVSIVQCILTSGIGGKIWLRIVKVSLPTVNQGSWQLVGVPLKIMSNGTSGTTGKIWLRIVKVSLPSVNQGSWQLGYP